MTRLVIITIQHKCKMHSAMVDAPLYNGKPKISWGQILAVLAQLNIPETDCIRVFC